MHTLVQLMTHAETPSTHALHLTLSLFLSPSLLPTPHSFLLHIKRCLLFVKGTIE
jgi:hypothetical protein